MTLPSFPLRLITAAFVFSCQNIWAISPYELINGIKEGEGGKQMVASNIAQKPAPQMSKSTPESVKTSSWFSNSKSTITEPAQVDKNAAEQALNNELAMIDRLANAGSLSNETAQKLRVAAIGKSQEGKKAVREKLANQILSQYCANEKTAKSLLETPEVLTAAKTPGSSGKSSSASTNTLSNALLATPDGLRPAAHGSSSGDESVPSTVAVEGSASSCEWVVTPDQGTIMNTLAIWANQAHWTLLWEHSRDFPVSANARFCGDFKSAIDQLIGAISQNDPIRVRLYSGNNVVRVTSAAN